MAIDLNYSRIDTAYSTCIEMFVQRGYSILEKDDERILALKEDGNQICACINKLCCKFNVERIQECISMMKVMNIWHGLIVYSDTVTPVAKKIVEESQKMKIELFHEKELQYNLTKHYLVPLHELKYKKDNPEAKYFNTNKYLEEYLEDIPAAEWIELCSEQKLLEFIMLEMCALEMFESIVTPIVLK